MKKKLSYDSENKIKMIFSNETINNMILNELKEVLMKINILYFLDNIYRYLNLNQS